ncbi:MAG TPA: histidine kinase [Candidatus Limnocylindrales bacterium]|nr:histidine kinase [Candidatus Limnocylindrales bacterium]
MRGRSSRLLIGVIGTVLAVAGETLALRAGRPADATLLDLAIGLTYLYGGLAIWGHEPANRTGRLMTLVGLSWFIPSVAQAGIPLLSDIASALWDVPTVILFVVVLSYPDGRLESRLERAAVAVLAIGSTALNALQYAPIPLIVNEGINGLYFGVALALMMGTVVLRRWLIAPPRFQRELLPVLVAGAVFLVTLFFNLMRRIFELPEDVGEVLIAANALAPAAIPIALLLGFYRQSERRMQALMDAIPDEIVRFTKDGRAIGSRSGADAAPPPNRSDVGPALVGRMFGAAPGAVRAATDQALERGSLAAFDFALERPDGRHDYEARLTASGPDEVTAIVRDFSEQRAAEAELRLSRVRIVEATDAERRRLERDLHDGAQQRLVSLSLSLRRLRARLAGQREADDEAIVAADEAVAEVRLAIGELRELARGIHPAILTEAGLGPAISALAHRSTVPTRVTAVPHRRLPTAVEATAYFVVSEALANSAKHASATRVGVDAIDDGSVLRVEIADDGVGGADRAGGTGIDGLHDRVAALGGRLTIDSPPGQGTLVVAEIPIA